jgi:ABC-type Zn uptake system ZnuABC Zn-binding protein ZnuA
MREVGYLEPQPGIPPGQSHLSHLIGVMRSQGASLLVMEDFYNRSTAEMEAEKAGARLVVLPSDVESTPQIKTWFDLVDAIVRDLAGPRS